MSAKKIDLAKLFKDPKAVPDDTIIKLADGAEVTFGDLRAYDTQRGGEVAAEIQRQQAEITKDRAALQTASERVAKVYIDLEAEKKALAGKHVTVDPNADPLAEYIKDPVFAPVITQLRNIETRTSDTLKALDAKMQELVKNVGQMGTTIMGNQAKQDFDSIMSADDPVRPKDLSLDALYKVAVENRVYDRNNLPDIKETYKRITADARHAHELTQARADERAKIELEAQEAALVPLPSGGHGVPHEAQKDMPRNLNDAFGKAGQDREMWKAVQQPALIGGGAIQ